MNAHDQKTIPLNAIGYATFILDPEHNIIEVNTAAAKLIGFSPEELIGKKCYEFFHDSSGPPNKCPFIKMQNSKKTKTEEMFVETLNGNFLVSCTPIFDKNDQLEKIIHIAVDITNHKIIEEKLNKLLSEKEFMFKEVHHRIKNNMNTVAGLMYMQSATLKDPAAIAILKDARSRVLSMMILYDKLYCTNNYDKLPFKEYLSSLVDEIINNFPNNGKVKIEKMIDDFTLDAKRSSDLGIIINEILTNIMKHAFTDRPDGVITLSAMAIDNRMIIAIWDNGVGIPESLDTNNSNGFGLQLVNLMTKSLQGTMKIERENGTKFILEFNL